LALSVGDWPNSRCDGITPGKELRNPLNRKLGGPRYSIEITAV